eukprot:TCALIF_01579-PA protein Name:"Similar to LRRC24 Leucine-rich repeat-containing protein 24 (Homo sapiens)" AED:0.34 eAED:0.35 QI:0/0/0/0.33/1/1/3/0/1254
MMTPLCYGGKFESVGALLLRDSQCPKLCECKWKKGKETVACVNANYIDIPILEDSGTQVLDFRGNAIKVLVDGIFIHANLLNLQEVHLPQCQIKEIHKFAFRDLINLMRLDLSDNELEAIPSAALSSVSQLRELSLSGNAFGTVKDYAFSNLAHLIKLELSRCRLRSLSPHAFVGLDTLEWLKLDQNHLSHLNPVSIRPLANLHEMDLQQNPWNCSCSLRPTRHWMHRFNIHSTVPPTCEGPDRLSQRSWSDLNIDDFACLPKIIHAGPVSQMQEETSNVTLMCRVMGEPAPQVDWFWQGQLIKNGSLGNLGSTLFLIQENVLRRRDHHDVRTSNVTILNADIDHGGEYICEAFNRAGGVKARMQLTLAKPITTTLHKRVEQSQVYVMAAFGGCGVIFVTLFFVCCVFSLRHKPIISIRQHAQQHYVRAATNTTASVAAAAAAAPAAEFDEASSTRNQNHQINNHGPKRDGSASTGSSGNANGNNANAYGVGSGKSGTESISMSHRTLIMPKTPPLRTSCTSTSLSQASGNAETSVQSVRRGSIPLKAEKRSSELTCQKQTLGKINEERLGTRIGPINKLPPNGVGPKNSLSSGHHPSSNKPSSYAISPPSYALSSTTTTSSPPLSPFSMASNSGGGGSGGSVGVGAGISGVSGISPNISVLLSPRTRVPTPKSRLNCDGLNSSVMGCSQPTSKEGKEDSSAISPGSVNCSRSVRFNLKPIHFEEDWLRGTRYTPQVLLRSPSDPLISFCTLPRSASLFADSMPFNGLSAHLSDARNGYDPSAVEDFQGNPDDLEEMTFMNRRVRFRTKSSSADSQEELLIDHPREHHLPHTCGRVQPLASAMASKFRRFSGSYEYPLGNGTPTHGVQVRYHANPGYSHRGKPDWRSKLYRNQLDQFGQPIWERPDPDPERITLGDRGGSLRINKASRSGQTYDVNGSDMTNSLIENRGSPMAWRNSLPFPPRHTRKGGRIGGTGGAGGAGAGGGGNTGRTFASASSPEDSDHKHVKNKREMIPPSSKWGPGPQLPSSPSSGSGSGLLVVEPNRRERNQKSPTSDHSDVNGPLDYHSVQLDHFLLEYQSLQEQLIRMREACTSIRKVNLKHDLEDLRQSISAFESRCGTSKNETVSANVADLKRRYESLHLRSILKKHQINPSHPIPPPTSTSPSTSHSSGSTSIGSTVRPPQRGTPKAAHMVIPLEFLGSEREDQAGHNEAESLDTDDRFPLLCNSSPSSSVIGPGTSVDPSKNYSPQWEHSS